MKNKVFEISHQQAWRIISAMQIDCNIDNFINIIRLSCYLNQSNIKKNLNQYDYQSQKIKKLKKPFPLNLLPIPTSNYFYLYDVSLSNIYHLAQSCDNYLMFELLIIDKQSFTSGILTSLDKSKETLYYDSQWIKDVCNNYFFCGFDFDDPYYETGISLAINYNFVPQFLNLYFKE